MNFDSDSFWNPTQAQSVENWLVKFCDKYNTWKYVHQTKCVKIWSHYLFICLLWTTSAFLVEFVFCLFPGTPNFKDIRTMPNLSQVMYKGVSYFFSTCGMYYSNCIRNTPSKCLECVQCSHDILFFWHI